MVSPGIQKNGSIIYFSVSSRGGNIKPTKQKSAEKIDGIVAAIMALDRCIRHEDEAKASVYDERGLFVF